MRQVQRGRQLPSGAPHSSLSGPYMFLSLMAKLLLLLITVLITLPVHWAYDLFGRLNCSLIRDVCPKSTLSGSLVLNTGC